MFAFSLTLSSFTWNSALFSWRLIPLGSRNTSDLLALFRPGFFKK